VVVAPHIDECRMSMVNRVPDSTCRPCQGAAENSNIDRYRENAAPSLPVGQYPTLAQSVRCGPEQSWRSLAQYGWFGATSLIIVQRLYRMSGST
jgi:hypothetical protein